MALTDLIIRNAKPAEKQQKLADERGLYARSGSPSRRAIARLLPPLATTMGGRI